jgi:hypothetical protein
MGAGLPIVFENIVGKLNLKGTFGVLAAGTVVLASSVIVLWVTGKKKRRT